MLKKYILFVLIYVSGRYTCFSYNNIPSKKNKFRIKQQNLENNIEIYESIKECNISDITTCGDKCSLCLGKKTVICNYCRGTGFLTMGDIIIGTGNACPICMGKGEKECKMCMGSGYIAKWKK